MPIETVSEFCRGLGLPEWMAGELVNELADRERHELRVHQARMQRSAGRPDGEALPLRDEQGEEWGVVEARIPAALAYNLAQRPGFGWEGLTSDEGMRDLLRDNPQCRVKTVGRIQSGWTGAACHGRKIIKKY